MAQFRSLLIFFWYNRRYCVSQQCLKWLFVFCCILPLFWRNEGQVQEGVCKILQGDFITRIIEWDTTRMLQTNKEEERKINKIRMRRRIRRSLTSLNFLKYLWVRLATQACVRVRVHSRNSLWVWVHNQDPIVVDENVWGTIFRYKMFCTTKATRYVQFLNLIRVKILIIHIKTILILT